ncbi:hypothetical protein HOD75_02790 [archaeon]|jgi:DNA repair protein NreA|nr:hypothetical protein [archaeon]MBT4241801.1 hypothetical protein [archaeon]MBT4418349.1 hypothetical protein [archaeon]
MQLFETNLCLRCKGKGWCGKPCKIYSKIKDFTPKTKTHFSGNSPPEIFVGRFNYPNINAGILSPDASNEPQTLQESNIQKLSSHEIWHKQRLPISEILTNRSKLIYGRFQTQIKKAKTTDKFLGVMQEVSMAYKSVSTEFFLKKAPRKNLTMQKGLPMIANPAPLEHARLQENPKVKPKVDYLVYDTDAKSVNSMKELYDSKIPISNISKILSAGLLGLKTQRRLVPTRWSITATDDTLSKHLTKKIKYYPEINEIQLFHSEYNGNHYEILLLPDFFSFEVLELEMKGSLWNPHHIPEVMQDYEFFKGRKKYADNVTGAYYANKVAFCEYLEKIKKQATAIFFREVRPEYYAPLGVGILREISREAFKTQPEKFNTIKEAINKMQTRLKTNIEIFTNKSILLKEHNKQRRLTQWF